MKHHPLVAFGLALLFAVVGSLPLPTRAAALERPEFTRTVYLIRHGAYIADAKADPELGPGLTPLGIAQARLTGARLRGMPVRFDSVTSSTLTRARETATVIHELLREVPMAQSPLLSECTPPAFRTFEDKTPEEQARCARRLETAFGEFLTATKDADRNDVIVAHGNVIRWLVTKVLGVDTRAWLGMSVAHSSITVIRVKADGSMRLLSVGDIGHIPPNLQSWGTDADPQLAVLK